LIQARAVAAQRAVFAAHAAVGAVLAAIIRHLDYSAYEYLAAKSLCGAGPGTIMQIAL
jgi:hypothetical protein